MAYASWSVVFGEQPSAAKWNILGTNDAYFDSLIGSGTALASWTPTLSGRLNDSKWTKTCAYQQLGKLVFCRFKLVASTTTPMDGGTTDAKFTLPVTSINYNATSAIFALGTSTLYDSGTAVYPGTFLFDTTTTALIRSHGGASASYAAITSASPFAWTTSDEIEGTFIYEAA